MTHQDLEVKWEADKLGPLLPSTPFISALSLTREAAGGCGEATLAICCEEALHPPSGERALRPRTFGSTIKESKPHAATSGKNQMPDDLLPATWTAPGCNFLHLRLCCSVLAVE